MRKSSIFLPALICASNHRGRRPLRSEGSLTVAVRRGPRCQYMLEGVSKTDRVDISLCDDGRLPRGFCEIAIGSIDTLDHHALSSPKRWLDTLNRVDLDRRDGKSTVDRPEAPTQESFECCKRRFFVAPKRSGTLRMPLGICGSRLISIEQRKHAGSSTRPLTLFCAAASASVAL
jgi:hypothetical protein